MHKDIILKVFLFCFALSSCEKKKTVLSKQNASYITISIDVNDAKLTKVSELYQKVNWIRLQTSPECLMGEIIKMEVHEGKWYFLSNNSLYVFNQNGDFVSKLSKAGKGPGEYIILSDFNVADNGSSILVYDNKNRKIIEYDSLGNFINETYIGLDGLSFSKLPHGNFAVYIGSSLYNEGSIHRLNILNTEGKLQKGIFP